MESKCFLSSSIVNCEVSSKDINSTRSCAVRVRRDFLFISWSCLPDGVLLTFKEKKLLFTQIKTGKENLYQTSHTIYLCNMAEFLHKFTNSIDIIVLESQTISINGVILHKEI